MRPNELRFRTMKTRCKTEKAEEFSMVFRDGVFDYLATNYDVENGHG
jgi:hypothetical protein